MVLIAAHLLPSSQRRFNAGWLHRFEQCTDNTLIGAQTAEGQAELHAVIDISAAAVIARHASFCSAIGDLKLTPAARTTQQPGARGRFWPHRPLARDGSEG